MAGIVTSNKTRKLVGNRLKEIDVPTTTLNTALYYADLTAHGAGYTAARVNAELNAYPTVVKNNASLALTPSANKTGVVYAMNGDSKTLEEFEFQRGSSGTYFDASGVMQLAAPNVPRINFENGVAKGLLIEPASSNLRLNSGFTEGQNSWTAGFTVVDSGWDMGSLFNKAARADSTQNIWWNGSDLIGGKTYTLSCYIRLSDGSLPKIGNVAGDDFAFIITNVFLTPKIIPMGNGVYFLTATAIAATSGSKTTGIYRSFVSGASAKILTATCFQLEESPMATSYIPTTTAIATRLADKVLSKRAIAVFSKNSMNVKTAEYPSTWMGNGVDHLKIIGKNLLRNSNSLNIFSPHGGASITRYPNIEVPEWGAKDANRIVSSGGIEIIRVFHIVVQSPKLNELYSISGWFKNNGLKNIIIHSNLTQQIILLPGESKKILFENIIGNGNTHLQFQIRPSEISDNVDFTWWKLKAEKGPSATVYSATPEDYSKVDVNGNIEISYNEPIHIQQFSLISRELKQEEV